MAGSKPKTKLSAKDMEQHRAYMKKYRTQSTDVDKDKLLYKDHYELLNLPRDASHTEVRHWIKSSNDKDSLFLIPAVALYTLFCVCSRSVRPIAS